MRPPEFTGGNLRLFSYGRREYRCFNEAAGIHRRKHDTYRAAVLVNYLASMRPPEFTGGNSTVRMGRAAGRVEASMRPPEFTGGNGLERLLHVLALAGASMRPPEFTGGNQIATLEEMARRKMLQ